MDMREMVDKVKQGHPLYGASKVSDYIQGVAARNSRYSELFIHVLPWFNIVNHDQVSPPSLCAQSGSGHPILILFSSTVLTLPSTINKRSGNWKPSASSLHNRLKIRSKVWPGVTNFLYTYPFSCFSPTAQLQFHHFCSDEAIYMATLHNLPFVSICVVIRIFICVHLQSVKWFTSMGK